MPCFVVLLRAVNVGGTGKLPMSALKTIAEAAGLRDVRTYIASGNVIGSSAKPEHDVKAALEKRLADYAGKPVGVIMRTDAEMMAVLEDNPFKARPANKTVAIFLDAPPPSDSLDPATGRSDEELKLGRREIYVYYPRGIGRSKLRIPAAVSGTARNINTIAKLASMARQG